MSVYQLGEMVSLVFMAIALGMDAFSVSLGMGMQEIRLKRIAIVGAVIGLFHIMMPFSGILLGQAISTQIGQYATLTGGLLLVGIGAHMVFSAFNHEAKRLVQPVGLGLLFFALSVSLDSFSVGLSLGLSEVKTVFALLLFGGASMLLTWIGMILGRKMHGLLGIYSEILGGSILCGFGLNILFG
ncbi:putative manganese efflux pump MntP [Lentibacillus kapialis]|uniref:Putative manganese efflux pump MntP n=1 Tax=Lentibacillus kapialis TaxID=340214 RepID=A0A917PU31_9BACI|nr:manganese efflux pump MntP family protein [Lentibacillus kapialis]GGJ91972.1 putative manganese efflux pump MntP [Lentibacillus kapialis]